MKTQDVLEAIAWAEENFGSLGTNRNLHRRDVRREVEKGLVRSIGEVPQCDEEGFTLVPERYAEGFVLTDAGRAALKDMQAKEASL